MESKKGTTEKTKKSKVTTKKGAESKAETKKNVTLFNKRH